VVPGLMDSHIHALRAGLTYAVELSWIGVPSLAKGLDLIREAARTSPPGRTLRRFKPLWPKASARTAGHQA
jgi:predicted amidohydrolase YtcJ